MVIASASAAFCHAWTAEQITVLARLSSESARTVFCVNRGQTLVQRRFGGVVNRPNSPQTYRMAGLGASFPPAGKPLAGRIYAKRMTAINFVVILKDWRRIPSSPFLSSGGKRVPSVCLPARRGTRACGRLSILLEAG